jgi:hypothetical protein
VVLKDRVEKLEQKLNLRQPSGLNPPDMIFSFVAPGPRDKNGRMLIPGGIRCDSHKAQIDGRIIERFPEESLEDFENRLAKIPRRNPRFGKLTFMVPDEG